MEENLDFFFDNNASQPKKRKYKTKKIKLYNTTRIKTSEQSKFADREYFGGGKKWKKNLISSLIITLANQKKENMRRKKKSYNTTRIKSLNFLTNISYNGVKEEGLFDRSFVFDIKKYQFVFFGKKDF